MWWLALGGPLRTFVSWLAATACAPFTFGAHGRSVCAKAWVLALGLGITGAVAKAQDSLPSADPPGYRELVDEAVREFGARNFAESRALFARAHALLPNARTHRGVGLAEFELRNYGECIDQLQAALSSQVKPLDAELRADTELLLARAENFVARVELEIQPRSCRLTLDGVPLQAESGRAVLVSVGEHVLEVQAAGYRGEKRKLSVRGGEHETVTVVLTQASAPLAEPSAKARSWRRNPWLWTAVGAVVAGAAVGAGVALGRDSGSVADPYGGSTGLVANGPPAAAP